MSAAELERELTAGVAFVGCEGEDGALVGVMGVQPVLDVDLIRHAYVVPGAQRRGVGALMIEQLRAASTRRMLVGTWAAATWAVRFYERHGFVLVSPDRARALLGTYWDVPARQVETSVVLANPPLEE
jgi:GNAT superfamily N-acetyltransferase